CQHNYITPYTF
nr:immunoglobulin light chain junction region [Macaca mulatta]